MAAAGSAKLKYVSLDKSTSLQPLIVNFTNGNLNENVSQGEDAIRFSYYKSSDYKSHLRCHRRTLFAETDRMVYVGHNFGQLARSNSLCKYLVGVYNSKEEKMKIYDAQMFTMQPRDLDSVMDEEEKNETTDKKELAFAEKSDMLIDAFGSARKKRAVMSRRNNQIASVDNTVSEAVQSMLPSPQVKRPSVDQQEEPTETLGIPPFNRDAQFPSEIYSLDDIITPEEYKKLHKPAKELEHADMKEINEWRNIEMYPEYILQHLAELPLGSKEGHHKSCCLLYLSYLMTLFNLNFRDFKRKEPLPPWIPEEIKQKFLDEFTLQKGPHRCVTKRLKDKQMFYILVLTLIIDNFCVDVGTLVKDLKVSLQRIIKHFRILGCKISSSGPARRPAKRKHDGTETDAGNSAVKKTASLSAPLPINFPHHISDRINISTN